MSVSYVFQREIVQMQLASISYRATNINFKTYGKFCKGKRIVSENKEKDFFFI